MTMRIGFRYIRRIIIKVTGIIPSANCYDRVIGEIWSQLYGHYDANTAQCAIGLAEPNNVTMYFGGGTYDRRV